MGDISPTLHDIWMCPWWIIRPQLMADGDVKPTINLIRICGLNVALMEYDHVQLNMI